MRHGRRRKDIWDQPWVIIAAIIGIVVVIGIAVFFFLGGGGSEGAPAAAVTPQTTSGGTGSPVVVSGTIDPSAIKELPTVSVPGEGVYVKVMYLGSFSGEYGMPGETLKVSDSGERVYEVVNASGTISAMFKKTDSSTRPHELTVEIWKDGNVLRFEKNTSPNGEVSLTYSL